MMATQLPGLRRKDFHVAIICAVDCEYDAVIFAFDEIWDGLEFQLGNAPGDHNKYKVGRIANRNAVLLLLTGMGKANAASGAASLRSSYTEIKLAIVTGICGGVPGVGTDKELLLGDVVISKCIVQYDLGRRRRQVTKELYTNALPQQKIVFLNRDISIGTETLDAASAVNVERVKPHVRLRVTNFTATPLVFWLGHATERGNSWIYHKNKKYQNFAAARAASATKAVLEAFPCAGSPSEYNAYEHYGTSLRNNFHQLWEILVACASQPESGEIVCVLDALDECNKKGRQDIFEALERFYFGEQNHVNSSKLKFLITSRPYDDLEMSFEMMATAESYIRLDGDDKSEEIRHEIDLVIDHKVSEFGKHFREEHRRAISERLKAMENRTYLWLHLTLSIIDEKRSAYRKPSSVQTLLSRLPSSVFDAYEKILSRSQDEDQARCLLNIILAATRPLTLDEVNWAFTLQAKDFANRNELEDDVWPRESLKMTIEEIRLPKKF
ncbi:5'-methylthioadenosine/S-adenosylhomocysteine nucleosidase [Colletotrichum sp. SAR 10_66]|nr:5'-methylthioadenosine/S-adenosylhomocysteine nucleosidase [Colletotrichum sp. SAR 10_66]